MMGNIGRNFRKHNQNKDNSSIVQYNLKSNRNFIKTPSGHSIFDRFLILIMINYRTPVNKHADHVHYDDYKFT